MERHPIQKKTNCCLVEVGHEFKGIHQREQSHLRWYYFFTQDYALPLEAFTCGLCTAARRLSHFVSFIIEKKKL
jgi:hypothetical protein